MTSTTRKATTRAIVAATKELARRRNAAPASGQTDGSEKRQPLGKCRHKFRLSDREYRALGKIRRRLADEGITVKRAQLVRAGLALLVDLDDSALRAAIREVIAPNLA